MSRPTATKIMVIRHAEKPYTDPTSGQKYHGVTTQGEKDKESLIVEGWQRAGALVVLFDPFRGPLQNPNLATPQFLFASPADSESKSERPVETITPLSKRLQLDIGEQNGKADYASMVALALKQTGPVLIAWQHQDIVAIAGRIPTSNPEDIPNHWPADRFDLVWVFDLEAKGTHYKFSQAPQNLLPGDVDQPILVQQTA